jgi:hypothetical protein
MKFEEKMNEFYEHKLDELPFVPFHPPSKRFVSFRPFKLVLAVEDLIGYMLLGGACMHYILTGKFFMIVKELPAIRFLF